MSQLSSNTSGGPEVCGEALRQARIAARLSVHAAGEQLHMPIHVIQALEDGRWDRLGAPIFVRGQLRSYAKLLNVDLDSLQVELPADPVPLVSHSHTSRHKKVLQTMLRRAVYVIFTIAFVVPVWYASRLHFGDTAGETVALDVLPRETLSERADNTLYSSNGGRGTSESAPYTASLTPLPRTLPIDHAGNGLSVSFQGESWMQVLNTTGGVVEQGLMRAGDKRYFSMEGVAHVTLGNAAAVQVKHAGHDVDLKPFGRTNVVHFAVSSDGKLVPVTE